jgi:hypothetical protein
MEIKNVYNIDTTPAQKSLSDLTNSTKKQEEASNKAFSGKEVESYTDKLKRLDDELKGQQKIIDDSKAKMQEYANSNKKAYKDAQTDLRGAKEIQKEITKEIQNTTKAQKEHISVSDRATSAIKKLGGAIAATFAVHQLVEFGKKSIEVYLEAEKAEKKLSFALGERHKLTEGMIIQAKRLQEVTIVSKEQILNMYAFAAAQGYSADQIDKLTEAALQFSAVTGRSFEDAFKELAGTLEKGTIEKGLAKLIGKHKELTSEQIKGGAVLDIINEKYKGFAENLGTTSAGKVEIAKNQMRELQEEIGKMLAPQYVKTLSLVRDLIRSILETPTDKFSKDISEGISNLTSGMKKAIKDQASITGDKEGAFKSVVDMYKKELKTLLDEMSLGGLRSSEDIAKYATSEQIARMSVLKNSISQIQTWWVESNRKVSKETKEVDKKEKKVSLDDMMSHIDNLTQIELDGFDKVQQDEITKLANADVKKLEMAKANADVRLEIEQDRINEQLKAEEEAARKEAEIRQATMNVISGITNQFYQYQQAVDESAKQKELAAAADNQQKIKEVNNKYAEKEKERAISQAWINAILGATNAVATANNIYAGIILAAGILVEAGIYTAQIQNTQVSFAKGVIGLKRRPQDKPGIDTIPAWLNEGESVMTTEETQENKELFQAIRNKKRDEYIRRNFIIPEINKAYISSMKKNSDDPAEMIKTLVGGGLNATLDDYELRRKLNETNRLLSIIVEQNQAKPQIRR